MTTTLAMDSVTLPDPAFCGALLAVPLGVDETAAIPAETVALETGELPVALEEPDVEVDEEEDDVTVARVVAVLEDEDELPLLTALLVVLDPVALLEDVGVSALEPSVWTMMLP